MYKIRYISNEKFITTNLRNTNRNYITTRIILENAVKKLPHIVVSDVLGEPFSF